MILFSLRGTRKALKMFRHILRVALIVWGCTVLAVQLDSQTLVELALAPEADVTDEVDGDEGAVTGFVDDDADQHAETPVASAVREACHEKRAASPANRSCCPDTYLV